MMMSPFPFGFSPIRRPYTKYTSLPQNFVEHFVTFDSKTHSQNSNNSINSINNFDKDVNSNNISIQNDKKSFEIFGLELHFDDLLIIALLFFLYQEGVKDTYLYIALILLLLS